jgi:uncharacterized protein YyaL (SSP411 family)
MQSVHNLLDAAMPNRLANETSPYLRQHADNPVAALAQARQQEKPILLSIGYSACHWCHVMAHESFEDAATAALMNDLFVNIKVDREERPDLDQIYQAAHAILSRRSGGWPLTMFLTPNQVPFFGGTYFPPAPRYGMPGFPELLRQIAAAWRERRGDIEVQNAEVTAVLGKMVRQDAQGPLDGVEVNAVVSQLAQMFDRVHGGFGGAPKFPNPADLALLLRRASAGDQQARHMATLTLSRMADGGIYDHLAGGFCRYSVDDHWEIPHFEKMLYDNGQLLSLYSEVWLLTGDDQYRRVVEHTVGWMLREMRAPGGAFYSSLDADSEGEEGRFYAWQREEVRQLLDAREYDLLEQGYGLGNAPNFEHAWHLHASCDAETVARQLGLTQQQVDQLWQSARAKLWQARESRVRPGRDDKILTSWNALAITGLARAGRACGRADWVLAAQQAVDFIRHQMWRESHLLATCKDGRAHLNAYLDDHAFLLNALLELMQTEFRKVDLDFAMEIAEALLARFEDAGEGGFFFTSHDHETLIQRPKSGHDNATPSGNGVAAYALQRLGHILGESRYLEAAENTLRAFAGTMQHNPAACPSLMVGLEEYLLPPVLLCLRGPQEELSIWKSKLDRMWLPGMMVIALPETDEGLPQSLRHPLRDEVNAWLCRGVKCLPVIESWEMLLDQLQVVTTDST